MQVIQARLTEFRWTPLALILLRDSQINVPAAVALIEDLYRQALNQNAGRAV